MNEVQKLKNLLHGDFSSLTIAFNDEHACNYVTAQKYADEFGEYAVDRGWPSVDEREKALRENSVWSIQWYPKTPIGFYRVYASTFETAFQHAMACAPATSSPTPTKAPTHKPSLPTPTG